MTKSAQIGQRPSRKGSIRPALASAVRLIVHDGLSITDAAQQTGYARESLSKALSKPHVKAFRLAVRRAWLESATSKAWLIVADLAQNAASEDVRLKACKVFLEQAGELGPRNDGDGAPRSLVQIVVNHAGRSPELNMSREGVIEIIHDPRAMRDPDQADGAE